MTRSWTHGAWVVREGNEDAFVAAWSKLARAAEELFGVRPTLLRDPDDPRIFKTFAGWPDRETREEFRSSDLVSTAMNEIEPLLESGRIMAFDEVELT
jgi:heme-degrading monooxygenase HmoA